MTIRITLAAGALLVFTACASTPAPAPAPHEQTSSSGSFTGAGSGRTPPPATMAPSPAGNAGQSTTSSIAAASPTTPPAAAASATAGTRTLYQRLGGYDAIAAVTDDFIGKMIADKQLGRFFTGLSQNSREILRQHLVEFLCVQSGGSCKYVGRDLGEVHTGLHITESDWTVAVNYLVGTLDKFHVPAQEKGELLTAVSSFKEDIVGK